MCLRACLRSDSIYQKYIYLAGFGVHDADIAVSPAQSQGLAVRRGVYKGAVPVRAAPMDGNTLPVPAKEAVSLSGGADLQTALLIPGDHGDVRLQKQQIHGAHLLAGVAIHIGGPDTGSPDTCR